MKKIIYFLLLFQLLSCGKEKDDLASQKEILNEIFLELIDSTYIEPLYIPPPPIPLPFSYNGSNKTVKDSIYEKVSANYYEMIKQFDSKVRDLQNHETKKIVVIFDTVYQLEKGNEGLLESHFKIDVNKNGYKIDLSDYSENEKYDFQYYSNLPTGKEIWKPPFTSHLATFVSISTIQFNARIRHI